jgi:RNA-directed DNA polymerase
MVTELGFASQIHMNLTELKRFVEEVQTGEHYTTRSISSKHGAKRRIRVPDAMLKFALKKSSEYLGSLNVPVPDHVHGFVKGRSTKSNAYPHLAKPAVLRVDIERFFESITDDQVAQALRQEGFTDDAASLCVKLFCVDGSLAIGFPTSPILSNFVFRDADIALAKLAKRTDFTFTRYVDDLIFSGNPDLDFVELVREVLAKDGWSINDRKTALMKRGGKQYVTGLTVADPLRPRIPVSLKRRLRLKIYLIEKHGFDAYMSHYGGDDHNDQPRRLLGLARYVASVEPSVGIDLLKRFDASIDLAWQSESSDDYWETWETDF